MSEPPSDQEKSLRRHLYWTLLAWVAVYTAAALVAVSFFEFYLKADFADDVAANTSTWTIVQEDDLDEFLHSSDTPEYMLRTQERENGTVAVQDLSRYYFIRSLKVPAGIALYLAGLAVIVFALLGKAVGYLGEFSRAVGGVVRHREDTVRLSPELAIAQGELNAIREAALADERASREAERRKNELVAYLAHDIRTPLTSVVGYLSLLDEAPDLPEEQRRRYVATALAKAEELDGLTSEFFEITRYNLASIPIERERVDARLFLQQLADEFLPDLQARGLSARVDAPFGGELLVDPQKMARALGNVLRNAAAFADVGTALEIAARRLPAGVLEGTASATAPGRASGGAIPPNPAGVPPTWEISITDHGREIAPEHLESIFDQFYRADASRPSSGNAGLGLAIAREIIQAHGGSIRAQSANGLTAFTVQLP